MSKTNLYLVGLMCVLMATSSLSAGVMNLAPSADSTMDKLHPTANGGSATNTLVGAYVNSTEENRAIMQFDLAALSGWTINNATLHLYRYYKYWYEPLTIDVFRLTESWTEGGVTWNTRDGSTAWGSAGGSYDGAIRATTTTAGSGTGVWYTWDITSLVQDWTDGASANYGLMLKGRTYWHVMNGLNSREASAGNPYLAIDATPEPATLGLLAVGAMALIRKRRK